MNTVQITRLNRQHNLLAAAILCALASFNPGTVLAETPGAPETSGTNETTGAGQAATLPSGETAPSAPDANGQDATAAEDQVARLDAVTVTAQKREQAAIDVPASVTAVRTDRLARAGLTSIEDYTAQIPGLSITTNGGSLQVTLRGISTGLSQSAPTTAVYIDEAPVGSANAYAVASGLAPDLDPAELSQIEVLKGPQGTLFGAGAMGGVLRYVTRTPNFDDFSGSVTLGGNSVAHGGNGSVGRFSVNMPVSDKLAFRVSGYQRDEAGWVDNPLGGTATNPLDPKDFNETTIKGGKASVAWKLADGWRLDAFVLKQQRDSDGAQYVDVNPQTLEPVGGEYDHGIIMPEGGGTDLELFNATLRGYLGTFAFTSSTTLQTRDSQSLNDVTLSYGTLLGLVLRDFDYGVQTDQRTHTRRFSQEFRLENTAMDGKLFYSGGIYYTQEDNTNRIPGFNLISRATGLPRVINIPGTNIPFPNGVAKARIDTSYEEVSLFANATYAFTDRFSLQGGVRFGQDEQDYDQLYEGLLFTPPVALVQDDRNNKFQYLLTGMFKPDENDAFYARLATGYRPGGPSAATPLTGADPVVGSDSLTSLEAGWKTIRWDDKLSFETAVFHTNWKDIQIQTSAAGSQFFVNGGKATSKGAEATLAIYPIPGLSLRGSLAYTDAALTEDTSNVIIDAGTPAARPLGSDGDRLPFVPEWTSSFVADYRWPVFGDWTASVGGSINFIGERQSNYSGRGKVDVPSYTTVNLNAALENKSWLFTLYAKNANDSDGIVFLVDRGLAPFTPTAPFGAGVIHPRTIGLDVTYRF